MFVLTFASNYDGAFVFDDRHWITDNESITNFDPFAGQSWLRVIVGSPGQIRPLACLSFAWQWYLWGGSRIAFHAFNDLLHAAAAVALYLLLLEFLRQHWRRDVPERHVTWQAAGGALLWAVHPAHITAVTFLTQRMAVMSGLFQFLALWFYLQGRRQNETRYYIFSSCSYLGALASKETAAILPVTLLLYEWLVATGEPAATRNRRTLLLLLALIPPLVMVSAYLASTSSYVGLDPKATIGVDFTVLERWLSAPRVYLRYLGLLAVPWIHALDYSLQPSRTLFDPWTTLPALAMLVTLVAILIAICRRHLIAAFLGLGFLLVLTPETLLFRLQLFFEYRLYVASAFLLPLIPTALWELRHRHRSLGGPVIFAGLALIAAYGSLTAARNRDWQSPVRLWEQNLRARPGSVVARNNLAAWYREENRLSDALTLLKEAASLDPGSPEVQLNLGVTLEASGFLTEAVEHYEKAVGIDPGSASGQFYLGNALYRQGRLDEAIDHFRKAAALEPENAEAQLRLAGWLVGHGRVAEAIEYLERVVKLQPENFEAHLNLGTALAQTGRLDEAVLQFYRALEINPNDPTAHYNTGNAYYSQGRIDLALDHLRRACTLGHQGACGQLSQGSEP